MIRRRAAAPLLVAGWLLMCPPLRESPPLTFTVQDGAPFEQWRQFRAFDSARECEEALSDAKRKPAGATLSCFAETPDDRREVPFCNALIGSLILGRCVPAEVVYSGSK